MVLSGTNMANVNNKTGVPCPKKSVREKKKVELYYYIFMVWYSLNYCGVNTIVLQRTTMVLHIPW